MKDAHERTAPRDAAREMRRLGVVIERIDDNVKTLVEGHQILDTKIDGVRKELKGEIGELRSEMNYKFEIVFDELRVIRNELKEKVGRDEFALLEKRVVALEKSKK